MGRRALEQRSLDEKTLALACGGGRKDKEEDKEERITVIRK
jgi:hypothetical protein